MFNGFEKVAAIIAIPLAWFGSIELRLKSKVNRDAFDLLTGQTNRIETYLWEIMKAQGIKSSIDPPDEITNNKRGDSSG